MSKIKAKDLPPVVWNKPIVDQDLYPYSPEWSDWPDCSDSSDSSDSEGGVTLNAVKTNNAAVLHSVSKISKNAVGLAPIKPSLVTKARIGIVRAPSDDNITSKDRDVAGSELNASSFQNDLAPQYEKEIDEPDSELIDDKLRSKNEALDGDINTEINRAPFRASASRRDDPTQKQKHKRAPTLSVSAQSNITDLGAKGLQIAYQEGRQRSASWTEDDLKRPLTDRLLEVLQKIPGNTKLGFFPAIQLDSLIDKRCVAAELSRTFKRKRKLSPEDIEKFAGIICGTDESLHSVRLATYKKIFVSLVLIRRTPAILTFIEHSVTDNDLPLYKVPYQENLPNIFSLARKKKQDVALACFQNWKSMDILQFEQWQWSSLAPFFHKGEIRDVEHYILQDQICLPFTADSRYDTAETPDERKEVDGGFSTVFRVGIHPEHHGFQTKKNFEYRFAIKCLTSDDRAAFKREADTLVKFCNDRHAHLVSLLATYEQFNHFYLIFHWAEADLRHYWKKNPAPSIDHNMICWVAKQCCGIADGLSTIHEYDESIEFKKHLSMPGSSSLTVSATARMHQLYGRHGDIKPQNILWFPDPADENSRGTLKITDFGLTKFSSNHSRSYELGSKLATSPSYRPPEYDLEDGLVGRSYDIWSLGCVYLEHICWLLGGWPLVEDFCKLRQTIDPKFYDCHTDTFFEIVHCKLTNTTGAMVKRQVTKFIWDLHHHKSCTEYIHAFLNLIQMDILVIKSPNLKEKERISCTNLTRKLRKLWRTCEEKSDYASLPAPWVTRKDDLDIEHEAVEVEVADEVAMMLAQKTLRVHDGKTVPRVAPKVS